MPDKLYGEFGASEDPKDPRFLHAALRGLGTGARKQIRSLSDLPAQALSLADSPSDLLSALTSGQGKVESGINFVAEHPRSVLPALLDSLPNSPESAGEFVGENIGPGELLKALRTISPALSGIVAGPKGIRKLPVQKTVGEHWQGADSNVRAEIPDNAAALKPGALAKIQNGGEQKLSDVLHHPSLFEAYPDLAQTSVTLDPKLRGIAQYNAYDESSPFGRISIGHSGLDDEDRLLSTILHETQHGVQDVEGYDRGFTGTNQRQAGSFANYLRDEGEKEARTVQARKDWNNNQLLKAPFPEHQDLEGTRLNYVEQQTPGLTAGERAGLLYSGYKDKLEDPRKVALRLRRGPANQIIPPPTDPDIADYLSRHPGGWDDGQK